MNELIAINYENEKPTVNGRELHRALKTETPYHKWFSRMCEYGFTEGKSYWTILTNRSDGLPGKPRADHVLTIGMAKELCMLQRSEVGKRFRAYFIQCEEAWNSPEKIMERALQIAHQKAVEAEHRIFELSQNNAALEIALNQSLRYYTVAKYNNTFGKAWNLTQCQQIGKALSVYCRTRAIEIRYCETNDERFGTVNSYPITAWEEFLKGWSPQI
ncbi:MAG: antA/AntB antirepressor family protein [Oscillospiraceae bacterium]|jgi:phage anti-repressor protein|nr:antA/AntB antirepressor family protein [Oscillospiraceae bacterium]